VRGARIRFDVPGKEEERRQPGGDAARPATPKNEVGWAPLSRGGETVAI